MRGVTGGRGGAKLIASELGGISLLPDCHPATEGCGPTVCSKGPLMDNRNYAFIFPLK